ncbi:MAG: hypothetical protein V4510_10765 [bacterium]
MTRLAAAVALCVALLCVVPATAQLRSFGGPVLAVEAPMGAAGAIVEYRYAFFVTAAADGYLKNNPAPYNAAYRPGWSTRVELHGPALPADLGVLVLDRPMELGHLAANVSYGLVLRVQVPAADLANDTALALTYVLAVHHATCACAASGASLDPSIAISLQAIVRPGAQPQALAAWSLPPVPHGNQPDWPDGNPGPEPLDGASTAGQWSQGRSIALAFAASALVALTLVLGVRSRRRARAAAQHAASTPPPEATQPVAPEAVDAPQAAPAPDDDAAALARELEERMKRSDGA